MVIDSQHDPSKTLPCAMKGQFLICICMHTSIFIYELYMN